jgi:hypothetical protein
MGSRTKGNSEANIIRGIASLLNKEHVKQNINYEEIESKYISQGQNDAIKTKEESEYKYRMQLKDISQKLGLDFGDSFSAAGKNSSSSGGNIEAKSNNSWSSMQSFNDTLNDLSSENNDFHSNGEDINLKLDDENNQNNQKDDDSEEEIYPGEAPLEPLIPAKQSNEERLYENINYGGGNNAAKMSNEFAAKTNEELRHEQARSMMADMGYSKENSEVFSMKSEEIQDYKINLLEEIDDLKFALEQIDPRVVERIPTVNVDSTTREIEEVVKILRIKHDRYRYSTIADELLLMGVQGIEEVFNGKNVILGRWQPNLTGWHTHVKVKLRRMRHDTSSIVGGTVREMGLGPIPRILLELIPNAFLYSNRNKTAYGQKTIRENVDQSIGNNIAQLNSM